MDPFAVRYALEHMTLLVDTREQDTPAFRRRFREAPCGCRRKKLDSGDYSAECVLPGGRIYTLADKVVIERKMSIDELCGNFTRGRTRFMQEFERLKAVGGKPYLLVEDASWEKIFNGNYRSRMQPNALVASLKAWEARYGIHVLFCSPGLSGLLIYKTLYYELKERLEEGDADGLCTGDQTEGTNPGSAGALWLPDQPARRDALPLP